MIRFCDFLGDCIGFCSALDWTCVVMIIRVVYIIVQYCNERKIVYLRGRVYGVLLVQCNGWV